MLVIFPDVPKNVRSPPEIIQLEIFIIRWWNIQGELVYLSNIIRRWVTQLRRLSSRDQFIGGSIFPRDYLNGAAVVRFLTAKNLWTLIIKYVRSGICFPASRFQASNYTLNTYQRSEMHNPMEMKIIQRPLCFAPFPSLSRFFSLREKEEPLRKAARAKSPVKSPTVEIFAVDGEEEVEGDKGEEERDKFQIRKLMPRGTILRTMRCSPRRLRIRTAYWAEHYLTL